VMHDLLAFLGTNGTVTHQTNGETRALGVGINGNGTTILSPSTIATTHLPQNPVRPLDPTANVPAPSGPRVDGGTTRRWEAPVTPARPTPGVAAPREEPAARAVPDGTARAAGQDTSALTIHHVKAPPSRQQLTEQLLTIVSERTGYPVEMLTPE